MQKRVNQKAKYGPKYGRGGGQGEGGWEKRSLENLMKIENANLFK